MDVVAVIVVVPSALAVTFWEYELTVATEVLLDFRDDIVVVAFEGVNV